MCKDAKTKIDSCTRPSVTRAGIELAFDGHAADGRKSYKTLARTAGKYERFTLDFTIVNFLT